MIRVAFLDDLPAVRAGLQAIVAAEPDLVPVGVAGDAAELQRVVRTARPDVLVLDVDHPGRDGLQLTLELKRTILPPRVVLYSSRPVVDLEAAATAAGADALVSKADAPLDLLLAIRAVAAAPAAARPPRPATPSLLARLLTPARPIGAA